MHSPPQAEREKEKQVGSLEKRDATYSSDISSSEVNSDESDSDDDGVSGEAGGDGESSDDDDGVSGEAGGDGESNDEDDSESLSTSEPQDTIKVRMVHRLS